jgi:hypothetical protein
VIVVCELVMTIVLPCASSMISAPLLPAFGVESTKRTVWPFFERIMRWRSSGDGGFCRAFHRNPIT